MSKSLVSCFLTHDVDYVHKEHVKSFSVIGHSELVS